ncbi:hypothetical protein OH77DRAFT_303712 [Trametes cingulata]|nr:hypothetical protein OH77DRAFT_303712 [Trametes cingulata]
MHKTDCIPAPADDVEVDGLTSLPNSPNDFGTDDGWLGQEAMARFWRCCEPWLAARGYTLYPRRLPEWGALKEGWYAPTHTASAPLPYAICVRADSCPSYPDIPPLKIAWAQDSRKRDVVLKLTNTQTDDYRIYQELLRCESLQVPGVCAGVLPPVAILDTPYEYSFVVMPRWGELSYLDEFETPKDIIRFMRCTLQGLSVLHAHRIVHRDIIETNMLVNYYCPDRSVQDMDSVLRERRRTGDPAYCLFDFNLSMQLPPGTSLRECRRPAVEATTGLSSFSARDIELGEHEYNPFAYDVACLGNTFRVYFSRAVPTVPLFAPLFDKMTTHVVHQRFTAKEALDFLDAVALQLPAHIGDTTLTLEVDWSCLAIVGKYWEWTPPDFQERWRYYATPSRSWSGRLVDWLCGLPIGWHVVRYVRAALRI